MIEGLVSAIITTHNRRNLCINALRSVKKQNYPNIEIILVDDASEKDMFDLIDTEEFEDIEYIYIPKEESKGGNHARNLGIAHSNGEFLAFLDDDDEWLPEKIQKQVNMIKNNPEIGIVACSKIFEYDFNSTKVQKVDRLPCGDLNQVILTQMPYSTSSLLIRTNILHKVGLFDEKLRFWQDYEFLIRICQITYLGLVKEPLLLYRVISQDKHRLTNNIEGWESAVIYIEKKHENLIKSAPAPIQKKHKAMIAEDGLRRSIHVKNKVLGKKYIREILHYESNPKALIRYFMSFLLGKII